MFCNLGKHNYKSLKIQTLDETDLQREVLKCTRCSKLKYIGFDVSSNIHLDNSLLWLPKLEKQKADLEIEKLHNSGLYFEYSFTSKCLNLLNINIEDFRYVISKLKKDEKILFYINHGEYWDEIERKLKFNEKYSDSIYWKNDFYGDMIRIQSTKNTTDNIKFEENCNNYENLKQILRDGI
jgi:hypothetical protein